MTTDGEARIKAARITRTGAIVAALISAAAGVVAGSLLLPRISDKTKGELSEVRAELRDAREKISALEQQAIEALGDVSRLGQENSNLKKDLATRGDEVARLKRELASKGTAAAGKLDPPNHARPAVEDSSTKVVNGVTFQHFGCQKNASYVLCNLRILSIERDVRDFYLTTKSIANASGSEVTASRASFGAVRDHRIHAWGDLAAGVPKDGSLKFEGIGVNDVALTMLELKVVVGNGRFSVRFKNVPIG